MKHSIHFNFMPMCFKCCHSISAIHCFYSLSVFVLASLTGSLFYSFHVTFLYLLTQMCEQNRFFYPQNQLSNDGRT